MLAFVLAGLVLASLSDLYFWRNIVLGLAAAASAITSIGIINSKVIAPYLAKPLANALQKELSEMVEAIVLSDPITLQIEEVVEEVVARESGVLIQHIMEMKEEMRLMSFRLSQVEQRQISQHAENRGDGVE